MDRKHRAQVILSFFFGLLVGCLPFIWKRTSNLNVLPGMKPSPLLTRTLSNQGGTERPGELTHPVFNWQLVESSDYRQYIANLRAIGCPEETIRDIIVADVDKLIESRRLQISGSTNAGQYWKSVQTQLLAHDEQKLKKLQELVREKRDILRTLLGIEHGDQSEFVAGFNPLDDLLAFLPGTMKARVMEIEQRFAARVSKSVANVRNAEDMKQYLSIQREKDAEIAKLLGPQEKAEYDVRLSPAAMQLRGELGALEISEDEFRKIVTLRQSYLDRLNLTEDKPDIAQRLKESQEIDQKMTEILGGQRFTEFQREHDGNYQAIVKVAERNGLPRETANSVFDLKQSAERAAQELRRDQSISAERRTEALRAIRSETEAAITKSLGARGFNAYKDDAYWLQLISPNPARR